MEPQLGLYVRLGEILGLRYLTISIRARLGPVVVWMVFPRLDPGSTVLVDLSKTLYRKEAGKKAGCSDGKGRRYEKGGIAAIVEGEAHGGLGLRGGLLGVQTQSHIGRIIISKLTYKLGGLLLLSPIGFRMEPQLGLYVRLGEMLGLGYPTRCFCTGPTKLAGRPWKRAEPSPSLPKLEFGSFIFQKARVRARLVLSLKS
ncbi:hypothetical protein Tco_0036297 [Tanacetum coccineum]